MAKCQHDRDMQSLSHKVTRRAFYVQEIREFICFQYHFSILMNPNKSQKQVDLAQAYFRKTWDLAN